MRAALGRRSEQPVGTASSLTAHDPRKVASPWTRAATGGLGKGGAGAAKKKSPKKTAARRGKGPKGAGASDSEGALEASGAARGGYPDGPAASFRPA